MARRSSNGEGTIYKRKDGRWEGAVYVTTTAGTRKRFRVYAKTRAEAHDKLLKLKAVELAGIPTPDKPWKLGDYLKYWLEEVVRPNRRPTTYDLYEAHVRLYLQPGLGHVGLSRLSVAQLQRFLNGKLAEGLSARKVQMIREVLSPALSRAMREEVLTRNVARLVELPSHEGREIRLWSLEELQWFYKAARPHIWFAGYLLVGLYGLRRGEVLGLRWIDVDWTAAELHVRQQTYRAGGVVQQGPLKTKAGRRDLPLLSLAYRVLLEHRARQQELRQAAGSDWLTGGEANELIFTMRNGRAIEPQNFTRAFQQVSRKCGLRVSRLHDLRHMTATMLKDVGVPARDAQLILGHSHVSVTQQIYQHDSMASKRKSLERLETFLNLEHTSEQQGKAVDGVEVGNDAEDRDRSRQTRKISRQAGNLNTSNVLVKPQLPTTNNPATGVNLTGLSELFLGDLTENRTPIARMRSGRTPSLEARITEAKMTVRTRRRTWFVGVIAVSLAVRNQQSWRPNFS